MKNVSLFLVVRMLSVSSEWTIAVGPLPSLQRDSILSLAYSLKTILTSLCSGHWYNLLLYHMYKCGQCLKEDHVVHEFREVREV